MTDIRKDDLRSLNNIETGDLVLVRTHPQDYLYPIQVIATTISDITVHIPSKLTNNKEYYEVVFFRDGRQKGGGWTQGGYSLHPFEGRFKAMYELERQMVE